MFKLNFKIALRNLWKNKGYTLINVGGLAIGLASCMILLLYVAYEWGYDRQSKNVEDTYVVYNHMPNNTGILSYAWTPGRLAATLKEEIPGVKLASHSTYPSDELATYKDNSVKKSAVYADPDFVKIQDYKFIKGNPDRVLKEVNSVILTESMAKTLFGDEDPLNKTIKLNNENGLKVEAVIADIPKNSSIVFDYIMPWKLWEKYNPWAVNSNWGSNFCLTLIKLENQEAYAKSVQPIKLFFAKHQKGADSYYSIHPLTKWHLYGDFQNGKSVGGKIDQVRIFFLLAFCILLIACVNFMNLSTARSERRAKEVGVRKAIGSSRNALMGQFMLESMLLALLGMVVAFVLIEVSLPYFNSVLHTLLEINYADWKFWSAFIGLTLVTGLLAGSYPAFYLSSFEPLQVLKGFRLPVNASFSVRQVLVVFQFVFAACLIVCTTVIYQQLNFIKGKSIGYSKNGLIEIPIQGLLKQNEQKLKLLKDQLLTSGAVSELSFFSRPISEGGNNTFDVAWPGKSAEEQIQFNQRATGYDFVKTMKSSLVSGRDFSPSYTDTANVIINETAAKLMGIKQPIGTVISLWDNSFTIIGVMKDFVMESPYNPVAPLVIYYDMKSVSVIVARVNGEVKPAMDHINAITAAVNPGFPVEAKFVDSSFEDKYQNEKLVGTVANWFGGFAIFISCLGLLGLALYMAEQRKKEISIRKVLGASNMNILTLLNKGFLKLVLIANLLAFPLAYIIMNKWLSGYSFRVSISFLPFGIALFLSLIIAIVTVSVQSSKVAKANPVDALKYE
jgi:putative ABC transport system permease protein